MGARFNRALQSKVARRVAVLFFASTMAPLAGLGLMTSARVGAELDRQGAARLADETKSLAMDALGQLALFADRLRLLKADTLVPPPQLDIDQQAQLERTGQVITIADVDGEKRMVMVVVTSREAGPGVAAAVLAPRQLFGLDGDAEILPAATDACVITPDRRTACTDTTPPEIAQHVAAAGGTGLVSAAGERFLVNTRQVPLDTTFGGDAWTLALVRPESFVRAPLQSFLHDFWTVTVLAGLVVTWITLRQVRRQLLPLDALIAGTERLARREFDQPVDVRSRDEFEHLGRAFNDLAVRLRDQFAELEAFNLGTLAALGRSIDAKSPWTAGHSDRVTQLAVAIAREMMLPEDEILAISRGGLVHDIGKLATPPGILDKPGPLTPEEFAIMKEHPERGVHILEPIPAFQPLLPIVGEHHERWDGTGYPRGLAGTNIARTARVLAVADVCDALTSDRPYRPGLPRAEVRRIIEAGAGTEFDPEVVAAFLAIFGETATRPPRPLG